MPCYKFGPFCLDPDARALLKDGVPIPINGKAFDTLLILVQDRGHLIPKDELLSRVWPSTIVDGANLTQSISTVRKLLEDSARRQRYIVTISGRGYQFIAPVSQTSTPVVAAEQAIPGASPLLLFFRALAKPCLYGFLLIIAVYIYEVFDQDSRLTLNGYVQLTHDGHVKSLVGADGSHLYVQTGDVTAEVPLTGGDTHVLASSRSKTSLGLSSDGSAILAQTSFSAPAPEGQLWRIPVSSGLPQPLGEAMGHAGAWAPDGRTLVYARGRDLFLSNEYGYEPRNIGSLDGVARNFSWSKNGKLIRFDLENPQTEARSIWEISLTNLKPRPLINRGNGSPYACCGTWTADGRYFIFESGNQIWALPQKPTIFRRVARPFQITFGPMLLNQPTTSGDSMGIYVVGKTLRGELVQVDSRSSRVARFLGGISAEFLNFSRNGQWVAYVTFPEGILWRSRLDGTQPSSLAGSPMHPITPAWSPDGKQIAFVDNGRDRPIRIYLVSASGTELRPLLPEQSETEADPTWSPDGRELLIGNWSTEAKPAIRKVVVQTGAAVKIPHSEGLFSPRWSPNGRFIAALSIDCKRLEVFDFVTQDWKKVAVGNFNFPEWSSDSEYLYVCSPQGEGAKILRFRILDRTSQQIVDVGSFQATGWFGFWVGYAPDGSVLALKDSGIQDVYRLNSR